MTFEMGYGEIQKFSVGGWRSKVGKEKMTETKGRGEHKGDWGGKANMDKGKDGGCRVNFLLLVFLNGGRNREFS